MSSSVAMTAEQQNSIQYGQNNHIEYAWSNIQQENILQLSFQMVRISDPLQRQILARRFVKCFTNGSIDDRKIMIKLLAHTRYRVWKRGIRNQFCDCQRINGT